MWSEGRLYISQWCDTNFLKNKKVGMLLWILTSEQELLYFILIPLGYLLSAKFCSVKVLPYKGATQPWQNKTLQIKSNQAE